MLVTSQSGSSTFASATAAMSKRAPKKYCSLLTWLEHNHGDLAEIVKNFCLSGSLRARRDGVTFVVPAKATVKKIADLCYGSNVEEGINMFLAHVIPGHRPKGADFSGSVGSLARVKLEVEQKSASSVTFKGGAKIKPASTFAPLGRRSMSGETLEPNTAVWEIEAGEMPTSGDAFDPLSARKEKSGGSEHSGAGRAQLMAPIIERCLSEMENKQSEHEALRYVMGLLKHLKAHYTTDLYKAVVVLDRSPMASLVILTEPYGAGYLSDEAVLSWNGAQSGVSDSAGELMEAFESLSKRGMALHKAVSSGEDAPAIFSNPEGVFVQSCELASTLMSNPSAATPSQIMQVYAAAVASNSVGSISPVWPAVALEQFGRCHKLWQDLVRFQMHALQRAMLRNDATDVSFRSVFTNTLCNLMPGRDYESEVAAYLGRDSVRNQSAAPTDHISNACCFIDSTAFMYAPRDTSLAKRIKGSKDSVSPVDRDSATNIDMRGHHVLEHYSKTSPSSEALSGKF